MKIQPDGDAEKLEWQQSPEAQIPKSGLNIPMPNVNPPKETVTISRKEYEQLQEAFAKLNALERAGVNNWEWYDDAMETLDE